MQKKYFVALLATILFFQTAFSQARESTEKFEGVEHPAFISDYRFPADITLGGIAQRLKQEGLATRSRKRVITNKGVHLPALSPDPLDLYIEVENKGRRGKNGSTVSLFVSKGKDNFVGSAKDPKLAAKAIDFLNSLQHNISLYALNQEIETQQDEIDDHSKDYKKEMKRLRKLQSKKRDKQSDLTRETETREIRKIKHKINDLDKDIADKKLELNRIQESISHGKQRVRILQEQLERER